jgi:hypothetical protein
LSTWSSLGGTWAGGPQTIVADDGAIGVFALGLDHAVHVRWYRDNSWEPWESLGGVMLDGPFVIAAEGRLDLFAVNQELFIFHKFWDGTWTDWRSLYHRDNGSSMATPSAVWSTIGTLDLFMHAMDGDTYRRTLRDHQWRDWERLAGPTLSNSQAVSMGPSDTNLFAIGVDRRPQQLRCGSSNTDWQCLDDNLLATAPHVVATADGWMDLFGLSVDRSLHHQSCQDGEWTDPVALGGKIAFQPRAVAASPDSLTVFVVGDEGAVWFRNRGPDGWTWWESLGGLAFSRISAVASGDVIHLTVTGEDGAVWHTVTPA